MYFLSGMLMIQKESHQLYGIHCTVTSLFTDVKSTNNTNFHKLYSFIHHKLVLWPCHNRYDFKPCMFFCHLSIAAKPPNLLLPGRPFAAAELSGDGQLHSTWICCFLFLSEISRSWNIYYTIYQWVQGILTFLPACVLQKLHCFLASV